MEITLNNGKVLILDKDEIVEDPKAKAIRWLQEYKERRELMKLNVEEMSAEECYDQLDRLRLYRQVHGRGRSHDAYQARHYCNVRKNVKKRLKALKAPLTRPEDGRVYGPGAAAWQRAGGVT